MFGKIKGLCAQIRRKPATAPDGRTDDDLQVNGGHQKKESLGAGLLRVGFKDGKTLAQAFTTITSGEPLNDKELLLEHAVAALQKAPTTSSLSSTVSDAFIKLLWNDLPHPSVTLAGPSARYREHDGGNNNIWSPDMGRAGTPYARNVPPARPKGPNLPDPELVFEQLLRREDGKFREHPSGLNRLFFSFATVVIHECFQTKRDEQWINETSSYVDLSTLYGNTFKEQEPLRTKKNGLIWPDSIASERIMLMPPGVIAVLLLFSRNHNEIAHNLLQINEAGKYAPWESLDEEKQKWQDNDIFQLARNINVGFFAEVVLKDYVAAILNTPRADSSWTLELGKEIKSMGGRVERGGGNVVSTEFAVLYHWHAALSAADAKWMEEVLHAGNPDLKSMDDLKPEHFYNMAGKSVMKLKATPVKEWTFGGLKRGEDGKFPDYALAELIKDCIEEPAHAFGAHGTPASLKVVDIMGQLQARGVFNCCSMNEFRAYLNLKPYETFLDWCEDKETARAAELLYGHIDNLELYPGLMAECTKPPVSGSGVCPGQTTGRGILNDAVSLVRGDRFLSFDLTSNTLTNWGVSKLGGCRAAGAYGGVLPTLLFKGLPGGFTGTSSYALLPFYTPKASTSILKDNGVLAQYDTKRPKSGNGIVSVHTQAACKQVFSDRDNFRVMYQAAILNCTDGHEFMIGWDDEKKHNDRSKVLHSIFFEEGFEANVERFYSTTVASLIQKSALKYRNGRRTIDIVRDVTNVAPILWLAERFAIPLKTDKSPRGLLSVAQLFDCYLVLFMYQSFDILPENRFRLREAAMKVAGPLRQIFTTHLKTQQGLKEKVVDKLAKGSAFEVGPDADRLYHALNNTKMPIGDMVGDIIGMSAPVAGNITQQASLLIDLYLSEGYEQHKARIIELAHRNDPEANRELQGYIFEGMRLAPIVPGLPRVANKDMTINDGDREVHIKAEQTILIGISKASMDPVAFPNPEEINPHRPFKDYILLGHGLHFCFGARLVGPSLAATLREVFKLKNIRRAQGTRGKFSVVTHEVDGVVMKKYLDSQSRESPIPTTLTLEFDE